MKDKNNKEILEGDIIDIHQTVNGQRLFVLMSCIGKLDVRYHYDLARIYEYDVYSLLDCDKDYKEIEVIGNIHDNPELHQ